VQTHQPEHPNIKFSDSKRVRISENDWTQLSNDLWTGINASIAARGPLEQNMQEWSDAYDMIAPEIDDPFYDTSNNRLPYIATQVEAMVAYIAGTVLVPRMIIVTGRTPEAAQFAPEVEKFYNAEMVRLRSDGSSYFSRAIEMLHQSIVDGVGTIQVMWNRQRSRQEIIEEVPDTDAKGYPKYDDDGKPMFKTQKTVVDVYQKDFAEWNPVPLKDLLLVPAESTSIEDAAMVWQATWLYEDDLNRMVRGDTLDEAEVERALRYDPNGQSDVASDRQGYYDKDASQQIGVGQGQGTLTSRFFRNRGPIKVWVGISNQFDMDDNGEAEQNMFWLHEQSQRMLGWTQYDYATGQRPWFNFNPLPRTTDFYGYSLIERLSGVGASIDTNNNARDRQIQLRMEPPIIVKEGAKLITQNGKWAPGAVWEAEFLQNGQPAVVLPTLPEIPIASSQQEANLKQYGSDYTGLNGPAVGGASSGRRSATEMRQQNAATGTRLALICNRLRITLGQVINFTHALNKQYLMESPKTIVQTDQGPQVFTLGLDKLMQDYEIGIAGATDPIDSTTRRNEVLSFVQTMMMMPGFAQDPEKVWHMERAICEVFGRVDTQQLIGTEDEARAAKQQQAQQQAAMQQHQQQLEMLYAQHGMAPPQQPKAGGGGPAKSNGHAKPHAPK
jgi:hypothetical protein